MADFGIGEAIMAAEAIGGAEAATAGATALGAAELGSLGAGALGAAELGAGALGTGLGATGASAFLPELAAIPGSVVEASPGIFQLVSAAETSPELLQILAEAEGTTGAAQAVTSPLSNAAQYIGADFEQMPALMDSANPLSAAAQSQALTDFWGPTGVNAPETQGLGDLLKSGAKEAIDWAKKNPLKTAMGIGSLGSKLLAPKYNVPGPENYKGPLSYFKYDPRQFVPYAPTPPSPPYRAQYAEGGIASLANGGGLNAATGPVERMSQNVIGAGGLYPQSQMEHTYFSTPTQMPASAEIIGADYDAPTNPYTGAMMAEGGIASLGGIDDLLDEAKTTSGGMSKLRASARQDNVNALAALSKLEQQKMLKEQHEKAMKIQSLAGGGLGGYSDGGRMLKGPGDGMSDSIPGTISGKQPARLADGEFVVPADVVSHLGNGSTDAGAKRLYGMMNKVRKARTGNSKQGRQINPEKYMPA